MIHYFHSPPRYASECYEAIIILFACIPFPEMDNQFPPKDIRLQYASLSKIEISRLA